jgi:hypothetical protein
MRGMRRRVVGLLGTAIAILLACHVVVELAELRFYQPTADASLRALDVFRQKAPRPDVVFVGSSQVRRGILAPLVEREATRALGRPVAAFNLGLQAGTSPAYAIIVRDLLVGEHQPALVVVGVGPRDLNANGPQHDRVVRHLAAPLDLVGPLGPRWIAPHELMALPALAIRAPATLLQLVRPETEDERAFAARLLAERGSYYDLDDLETEAGKGTVSGLEQRTRRRARHVREELLDDFAIEGRGVAAMRLLLDSARARGIDVVLLGMPRSEAFAALAYRRLEEKAVQSALQTLGAGLWIEAVGPEWAELEGSFYDGDHLGPAGAERFTRLLTERVVVPRLTAARGAVGDAGDRGKGEKRGAP